MRKFSHVVLLITLLWSLLPPARPILAQESGCFTYSFSDATLPSNFSYIFGSRLSGWEWMGIQSQTGEAAGYQTIAFGQSEFQTIEQVVFSISGDQAGDILTFQALANTGNFGPVQFNNRTNVQLYMNLSGVDAVLFSIRAQNSAGTPGSFFIDAFRICGIKKTPAPTPGVATATPGSGLRTPTPGNGSPTATPPIRPQGRDDGMMWLEPTLQDPSGPAICTGWLYYNLKSVLDSLLYPLFWFGSTTKGWNSITAEDMAEGILSPISGFLGYITFFNNLTPAFTSLSLLLFLYVFILSIKASLSMIKWLKQILPFLG
jgi:hypothetical protein